MRVRAGALAVMLALVAAAPSVCAQDDREEARAAFQQGVRLLEDARYAEAVTSLERSRAMREVPPVLYNLALAYRGAGAYLRAVETFERFLTVAPPREPLRADAAAIIEELRRAIGRVRVTVRGEATELRLDEHSVALQGSTLTMRLDPGRHVFEARREGYRPAMRSIVLSPGESEEVELDASESPLPATLEVQVNVADATIVIDGRTRGGGAIEVGPGIHVIEVSASGHVSDRREFDVAPGSSQRVVVNLATRPSVLTRWWFWTGAAVLTAGLVVGGVLLFSGTEAPVQGTWGTTYGAVVSW